MALSIGFRTGSFLPALLFKLRGLDFYPGGTFTHCSCQPSLDAHLPVLIRWMRFPSACVAASYSHGTAQRPFYVHTPRYLDPRSEKDVPKNARRAHLLFDPARR